MNIYELSPLEDPLSLSFCWSYLFFFFFFTKDIYFEPTSGVHHKSADLCEPYAGVNDICEVEEEECIVSL